MKIFLGVLLLVMSIFLIIAVLMQNGKSKRLSGSIAGGAETFFGKTKSRTIDAVLSKVTTIVAIVFIIVVIVVYVAFGGSKQEINFAEQLASNPEITLNSDDAENNQEEADGAQTTDPSVEGEEPAEGDTAAGDEAPVEGDADEATVEDTTVTDAE